MPAVSTRVEITPQPVVVGPVTITVNLSDAQGNPLPNAQLKAEGNMSHAGMSPVFGEGRELPEGHYQAQLDFAMAGDWVVLLHIKLPTGQLVERQIDVKGVRSK